MTLPSLAFVTRVEGPWHGSRHLFTAEQGHVSRAGWHRQGGKEAGGVREVSAELPHAEHIYHQ